MTRQPEAAAGPASPSGHSHDATGGSSEGPEGGVGKGQLQNSKGKGRGQDSRKAGGAHSPVRSLRDAPPLGKTTSGSTVSARLTDSGRDRPARSRSVDSSARLKSSAVEADKAAGGGQAPPAAIERQGSATARRGHTKISWQPPSAAARPLPAGGPAQAEPAPSVPLVAADPAGGALVPSAAADAAEEDDMATSAEPLPASEAVPPPATAASLEPQEALAKGQGSATQRPRRTPICWQSPADTAQPHPRPHLSQRETAAAVALGAPPTDCETGTDKPDAVPGSEEAAAAAPQDEHRGIAAAPAPSSEAPLPPRQPGAVPEDSTGSVPLPPADNAAGQVAKGELLRRTEEAPALTSTVQRSQPQGSGRAQRGGARLSWQPSPSAHRSPQEAAAPRDDPPAAGLSELDSCADPTGEAKGGVVVSTPEEDKSRPVSPSCTDHKESSAGERGRAHNVDAPVPPSGRQQQTHAEDDAPQPQQDLERGGPSPPHAQQVSEGGAAVPQTQRRPMAERLRRVSDSGAVMPDGNPPAGFAARSVPDAIPAARRISPGPEGNHGRSERSRHEGERGQSSAGSFSTVGGRAASRADSAALESVLRSRPPGSDGEVPLPPRFPGGYTSASPRTTEIADREATSSVRCETSDGREAAQQERSPHHSTTGRWALYSFGDVHVAEPCSWDGGERERSASGSGWAGETPPALPSPSLSLPFHSLRPPHPFHIESCCLLCPSLLTRPLPLPPVMAALCLALSCNHPLFRLSL